GPDERRPDFAPESWETWWGYHEASILRLRERVDALRTRTPSEESAGPRIPEVIVGRRIVPALLAELARNPGAERTGAALTALARLGPRTLRGAETTVELLVGYLAHRDRAVAESACLALGIVGDAAAVPVLVSLLRDDAAAQERRGRGKVPEATRTNAAYALGVALQALQRPDVVRYAALELMAVLAVDESSLDLRVAAVVALGECRTQGQAAESEVVDELLRRLADVEEQEYLRAQAATSLGALLQDENDGLRREVLALLLDVLAQERTTSVLLQQGVTLALGRLGGMGAGATDGAARAALRALAEDGDTVARGFALLALAEIGSRPALELGGESPLSARGPAREVEGFLRAALLDSKARMRPWAALALGLHGHALARRGLALEEASRGALARLAGRERSAETASALALATGLAGAHGAIETLGERSAKERDPSYSSLALGFLRHGPALEHLRAETKAVDHSYLRLARVATARALLGDAELVPGLVAELARAECDRAKIALCDTLGTVGDAR
ncbi:MAG: HEAT repeat domain-containing protein, partial [Planctomycetota bacterium]